MARGERGGGEALGGFSARESTSTNYLRQWAVQVRRRARPATSLHRVAGRTPVRGSTVAGMGKRRRTALRRRARFPLAPGLRHCSRSAHLWQSSRAARKTARCVKAFSCRNSALPECRSCRTAQRSIVLHEKSTSPDLASTAPFGPLPVAIRLWDLVGSFEEGWTCFGWGPLNIA